MIILLSLIICITIGLYLFYKLYFLRKPNRHTVHSDNVLVSPASGKIISIISSESDCIEIYKNNKKALDVFMKDLNGPVTIVSIMLTVFDVHYQRASFDGTIISQEYHTGRFKNAVRNAANLQSTVTNENNQILIETPKGIRYKIIQIAGYIARRIVSYKYVGDQIRKGDLLGLIKLGSQVTIVCDNNVEIIAQVGQKVIDGETIIGILKNKTT